MTVARIETNIPTRDSNSLQSLTRAVETLAQDHAIFADVERGTDFFVVRFDTISEAALRDFAAVCEAHSWLS